MTGTGIRRGPAWAAGTAWGCALVAAALLLAASGYRSRDPDSALYAGIAAKLTAQPAARWVAPEWWGHWSREGLFREHPVGIFVLPALLAKLGYPAPQAAYAVNAVYQVLSLVLIQRLAGVFASGSESRALVWLLQLIPVAFVYRIRANHEPAVLLCLLAALYGTERSRTRPQWSALTATALVSLVVVKGVFAVLAPPVCGWWLFVRRRSAEEPPRSRWAGWPGLAVATAAAVAAGVAYEALYRGVTGEAFFAVYLGGQLGVAALPRSEWGLLHKVYNLVWYLPRVVWFAFPWSLLVLAAAWSQRTTLVSGGGREPATAAGRALGPLAREGLAFTLGAAALYVSVFSLSDRKAERYIFPVYYLAAGCGAVIGIRQWPWWRRLTERLDRYHVVVAVALWLGLFLASLAGAWLRLPRIKLWAPE